MTSGQLRSVRKLLLLVLFLTFTSPLAAQSWREALARMPLPEPVTTLTRSNCVDLMLRAFCPDNEVKAIVFMPGSTDELYFFRRIKVQLTNDNPTLLTVVEALETQSAIKATFQPPLLLLHTDEDTLEPLITIKHHPTYERLQNTPYLQHVVYNDRNWDDYYPHLKKHLKVRLFPGFNTAGSRHFFRPSIAGWNLTGIEAVRALSLASKTVVTVERKKLVFLPDRRKEKPSRVDVLPKGTRPAIRDPE